MQNPILHDHSLASLNTFRIPARARHYLRVQGAAALDAVRRDPLFAGLPRLVLGGGSNMLFTRDFDGIVLHMAAQGKEVLGEQDGRILVRAEAGENWHAFVQWTLAQGLGGDKLGSFAQSLGMSQGDLSSKLSELLPNVVDKLTPDGQLPGSGDLGDLLASVKKHLG